MIYKIIGLLGVVFVAAGCTAGQDSSLITGSIFGEGSRNKPIVVAPTLVADVAPEYALAVLPNIAGNVLGVRQKSTRDQINQTVVYPKTGYGTGENKLTIVVARATRAKFHQAPTMRQLQLEIRRELPGTNMQIVQTPGENVEGVFGYAIGKSSVEGNCIFGWQNLRSVSRSDQDGLKRFTENRYGAMLRLRYCSTTLSEQALISLLSGMRFRDVSDATIEMLRFAEGSGSVQRAAPQVSAASGLAIDPAGATPAVTQQVNQKSTKVTRKAQKPIIQSAEPAIAPDHFKTSSLTREKDTVDIPRAPKTKDRAKKVVSTELADIPSAPDEKSPGSKAAPLVPMPGTLKN